MAQTHMKTTGAAVTVCALLSLAGCKSDAEQCVDAGIKAYELSGKRTPAEVADEKADRWLVCLSVASGKD